MLTLADFTAGRESHPAPKMPKIWQYILFIYKPFQKIRVYVRYYFVMEEFAFIKGLFYTALLFALCFIAVFGLKALLIFSGLLPIKRKKPIRKKRVRKSDDKTLYIDPNKINKILVRAEKDKSA